MIKKLFLALTVVLMATTAVAQTTLGQSCDNPIPVDENYEATVDGPCTLWYVANTYDLPLHVYFSPYSDKSLVSPEVEVDFTCTPGVYEDSKLDSLINLISDFDIDFPVEFLCDLVVRNGKNEWDLSIDKSYRERMAKFGITYNVKALVKVTFHEGGNITLKPDTLFRNCVESADFIQLGDTIDILPNDTSRVFIVSYSDWQNEDSIRFVWSGKEEARVWLATTMCDFVPNESDPMVWTNYGIFENQPYKLYTQQMKDDIKANSGGGMFYGKILSSEAGRLVVEKIPKSKPLGDAQILEYGKSVQILANDTNTLYCFPKTWTSTQFISLTQFAINMYMSNQPDFDASNALASYLFDTEVDKKALYLSTKEIIDLKSQAKDDYIYVRFKTASSTLIIPNVWESLECLEYSVRINSNEIKRLPANSSNIVYRFLYDDFVGYDLIIKWTGNKVPVYIADTCSFVMNNKEPRLLLNVNIPRRGQYKINAETLEEWKSRVGEEGYIYISFDNAAAGSVTFQTEKPIPADPEIITNPCVANSIELKAGDQITLNLDSAFTIYRINYAEWVAKDNKLAWSGSEPLHTFVAETCQFSVAPYNKYVVNYVVVPAAGEYVLDVATLTQYADKVDADGYLYIRFLTEKEGTLSVTSY